MLKKPCVHLICNAHLDPVWQWRWEEGCAEAIATFRNAAHLLNEYPDLIFNHNESVLYRWIQQYDFPLFEEIQELVRRGRWFISGGWYLQPDVNLPGIESLIRHIIEGRRYFYEYFKVRPKVAYNFDSFGHSGGLPQILSKAGYKMYIHMRPQQTDLELPSDLYRWRGVDGSEIIGYRIAVGLYHTEFDNIEQRLAEGVKLAVKLRRDVPVFWGIGNHGGGATREDLQKIAAFIQNEKTVQIIHSNPDYYFEAIANLAKTSPVVNGDLQKVFTGCYTSLSRLKRKSLESYHTLIQAESISSLIWWILQQDYPEKTLEAIWRNHLFNDFHDILPGTCIEPAEKDALELYGKILESVRRLRLGAVIALNQGEEKKWTIPVTVLNTNTAITKVPIEVECMISYRPKWTGKWHLRLSNSEGEEILCQEEQPEALLPFNVWRRKVVFLAKLPSFGIAHYQLQPVEGEVKSTPGSHSLDFYFNSKKGLIDSLCIEKSQILTGNLLEPIALKDEGDSWGTDCKSFRDIEGTFVADEKRFQIIEENSIRTIYESFFTYKNSKVVLHTISYSQWPVLEFRFRVQWNEERKRLKLSIPTIFDENSLLCEVPGGIIARPSDGEEHVHGRWLMLSKKIGKKKLAVGIVNNGLFGFDYFNGIARLSALRSAAYCHEKGLKIERSPARKFMDLGIHDLRLLIIPGESNSIIKILPGLADWMCAPPVTYSHLPIGSYHKSANFNNQKKLSFIDFIAVQPENVRLIACKQSFDHQALILRLQESAGIKTTANIKLEIPTLSFELLFKPLEIRTIRVNKNGDWKEVDLVDEV